MKLRRIGSMVVVDEGDDGWSFPDPSLTRNVDGAYDFLLRVCPTTRDAMKKLADMRRALRQLRKEEREPNKGEAGGGANGNP